MSNELVAIGKIVTTHGYQGEVKVALLTDFPERYRKLRQVIVSGPAFQGELEVAGVRFHKNVVIVKFARIDNMEEAARLRGSLLQVSQDDLVPLAAGQYYIFQLVGLEVLTIQGEMLGVIKDIIQTGANDVYVVKNETGKEYLIPALKTIIKEIDLASSRVVIEPLPGLLDL